MLNISGLDFLALVFQISNSFDLKAFFQVLFSLILTVYKGHIQLLFLGAVCSMGLFVQAKRLFYFFFRLKSSNGFHVETHFFGRSFIFCHFVCNYGALNLRLRGSHASVSDHVMTSKDYINVEHIRN